MGDIILTISTSAITAGGIATLIYFTGKTWITERIKNVIKHEYDEKLESHKAQLRTSVERDLETHKDQLKRDSEVQLERLRALCALKWSNTRRASASSTTRLRT
jgi:hypothetical protein